MKMSVPCRRCEVLKKFKIFPLYLTENDVVTKCTVVCPGELRLFESMKVQHLNSIYVETDEFKYTNQIAWKVQLSVISSYTCIYNLFRAFRLQSTGEKVEQAKKGDGLWRVANNWHFFAPLLSLPSLFFSVTLKKIILEIKSIYYSH